MSESPGSEAYERAHSQHSDELLEELHAELADHLASAAEELVRGGTPPEEARAVAQSQFGNVDQIVRRCWWIRKGDEVMTRVLGITLLALVTHKILEILLQ